MHICSARLWYVLSFISNPQIAPIIPRKQRKKIQKCLQHITHSHSYLPSECFFSGLIHDTLGNLCCLMSWGMVPRNRWIVDSVRWRVKDFLWLSQLYKSLAWPWFFDSLPGLSTKSAFSQHYLFIIIVPVAWWTVGDLSREGHKLYFFWIQGHDNNKTDSFVSLSQAVCLTL